MLAQVSIDEDGAVTVLVDSEEAPDDETALLMGLTLDDMLNRASSTAISTWFGIHTEPAEDTTVEAGE